MHEYSGIYIADQMISSQSTGCHVGVSRVCIVIKVRQHRGLRL